MKYDIDDIMRVYTSRAVYRRVGWYSPENPVGDDVVVRDAAMYDPNGDNVDNRDLYMRDKLRRGAQED